MSFVNFLICTTGLALNEARKRIVLERATTLFDVNSKVIKDGRMFSAFLNAGHRFKIGARVSDEWLQLYEDYCENPNGEKGGETLRELEAKEEELYEGLAYECAGGDTSILKALDYHNDIADGLLISDIADVKAHHS